MFRTNAEYYLHLDHFIPAFKFYESILLLAEIKVSAATWTRVVASLVDNIL